MSLCLIAVPWHDAYGSEPASGVPDQPILSAALEQLPAQAPLLTAAPQTVASTNEPKLLLGIIAGGLIVGGVAMLAYGATAACKTTHPTGTFCSKNMVTGAMAVSGGTVMLVVWALSK